jgi:hypothetical protein
MHIGIYTHTQAWLTGVVNLHTLFPDNGGKQDLRNVELMLRIGPTFGLKRVQSCVRSGP